MREGAREEAEAEASREAAAEERGKKGSGRELGGGGSGGGGGGGESRPDARRRKKREEATCKRLYGRKLRERRAAAAAKWSAAASDAASRVWNLHRVLARRNDPVTRKNFLEAVSESAVPREFAGAEARLTERDVGAKFSLFSLFWAQMSIGLGGRIQRLLRYDGGALEGDVAALYPAVRSASLSMVSELYDVMQMGLSSSDPGVGAIGGA